MTKHIVRRGATLLEVLVVIGIIGTLLALLLPAVQSVRQAAALMQCSNQLRQFGLATHNYANERAGDLPFWGTRPWPGCFQPGNVTTGFMSVFYCLLPFIEQEGIELMQPADSAAARVPLFVCPSDSTNPSGYYQLLNRATPLATASYVSNSRTYSPGSNFSRSFSDGTSNTVLIAERVQLCSNFFFTTWAKADSILFPSSELTAQFGTSAANCQGTMISTAHRDSMPLLMGDGSVRRLAANFNMTSFYPAWTPAGNDLTPDF